MKEINVQELIKTCDTVARRCTMIGGGMHGSSWLFDKLMRTFESHDAIEAVTYEVFISAPVMKKGEAEIGRDGSLRMYTTE